MRDHGFQIRFAVLRLDHDHVAAPHADPGGILAADLNMVAVK
jgi:hypothetical protein